MARKPKIAKYTITCKQTDEVYVGSATYVNDRLSHHKRTLKTGTNANPGLQKIFDESKSKVFEDIFQIDIVKVEDREAAYVLEQQQLDELKGSSKLLNVAENAKNPAINRVFSEETKAKLSASLSGRSLSMETRAKIGDIHRCKQLTQEHREILSERARQPRTSDHVRKVAEACYKPVVHNGVSYPSVKDFRDALGLSSATASRMAKKLRDQKGEV